MVFPIAGGTQDTSYEVENSLRFNNGDNPNLAFTPSSAVTSERKTFTISWWVKRSADFGTTGFMWEMGGNDNANERIIARFDGNNRLNVNDSSTAFRIPNRLFRDPSAWYHIVVAFDTTDSTADNRVKVYVNGVQETSFLTSNNPGQNDVKGFSHNSEHTIGRTNIDNGFSFDGYMAEFHAVGGSQLDPTSFGKFNENGVWIPKKYTGSHGTNGFYLEFKQTGTSANSSGIGADTSGNDNHFAVSNLAAIDVTTDTCTNNFCTLNSLSTRSTLSEGNLKYVSPQGATTSTIAVANGQWYMEFLIVTQGGILSGFVESSYSPIVGTSQPWDHGDGIFYYTNTGQKAFGSSQFSDYAATSTNGDIIGVAIDIDNNTIQFYKNGSALGSISNTFTDGAFYTFVESDATSATNSTGIVNFGHDSSFAGQKTAQNNSDENGYGDFYYTPPSGYYAICTKNLAEFG